MPISVQYHGQANASELAQQAVGGKVGTKKVLFVGFVWPEHGSSAAGVRTRAIIEGFQSWGWEVHCHASASRNSFSEELDRKGVVTHQCLPNREEEFAEILENARPDVVIFDRFLSEEAFSFRVRELRPGAMRVLDMQDVHALRRNRQAIIETGGSVPDSLAAVPALGSTDLVRELSSIHRSDLTFVCSPVELSMLTSHFSVPRSKLALASFFCDEKTTVADTPGFSERLNFMTIGNWRHAPNADSARWLRKEIWPLVRKALPEATIKLYGAYPDKKVRCCESSVGLIEFRHATTYSIPMCLILARRLIYTTQLMGFLLKAAPKVSETP